MTDFTDRYGPWALVLGASEGIGAAYARRLAQAGVSLLLVARRLEPLQALADGLRTDFPDTDIITASVDVGAADLAGQLTALVGDRDVGLVLYNATLSTIGPYLDTDTATKQQVIDINVRGPVIVADAFGPKLMARGRGGLIFMSSLAGQMGAPLVASYGASKAFMTRLAESLWEEWSGHGVDVLACIAGATDTPGFNNSTPRRNRLASVQSADGVARQALAALGKKPLVVTGFQNRLTHFIMTRLLPRRAVLRIFGSNMRKMYGPDKT